MLQATYIKHIFKFNFPGGTSRGVLTEKPSYFIKLWDNQQPSNIGIGEVSLIPGLSPENEEQVENELHNLIKDPEHYIKHKKLSSFPALKFGIETALLDLDKGGQRILYPTDFTKGHKGIQINGLVWMGSKDEMFLRLKEKIESGFKCIKIKVGAIDFDSEMELLKYIRSNFSADNLEIRVDANGAFLPSEALIKLEKLSKLNLHSIEQPIKQGQWPEMEKLCKNTPLPIALDEELIGINSKAQRIELLDAIKPQFIILKPSLIGGLSDAEEWSSLASERNIAWWITSALEGNIGLSAISQWTFKYGSNMPQGLGTGQVFSNNIASPLEIRGEELWYNINTDWEII